MEPWGAPTLTGYSCEDFPSRTTPSHLLLRKEEIRPNIWPEPHTSSAINLFVSPTMTNCSKELHLKCGRVPDSFLKALSWKKTSPFLCENQPFFIMSECCHLHWNWFCFFLLLFIVWWSIFDQPFRRFLPLSCFCACSQWLFKVDKKTKNSDAFFFSFVFFQFRFINQDYLSSLLFFFFIVEFDMKFASSWLEKRVWRLVLPLKENKMK